MKLETTLLDLFPIVDYIDHSHYHSHGVSMKTVSKGVLKAKMLEYFREVEETGEELIVTSNNIPTLVVKPIKKKMSVNEVFGDLRGQVDLDDSIMEPDTEEWEQDQ